MTATLVNHDAHPPSYFSCFGGNADLLTIANFEADFAATNSGAIVQELDPINLRIVWQAATSKAFRYHANQPPSLFPGRQW